MSNLRVYNRFPVKHFTRDEFLTPFDRIFDDFFKSSFPGLSKDVGEDFFSKGSYPRVNVVDNIDNITIEDSVLTIKAESNQDSAIENSQYVKREIKRSAFQRSFNLGENLNQEKISGECENGVLKLIIPKVIPVEEEKKITKVKIK